MGQQNRVADLKHRFEIVCNVFPGLQVLRSIPWKGSERWIAFGLNPWRALDFLFLVMTSPSHAA
jgi:hypothetical protein